MKFLNLKEKIDNYIEQRLVGVLQLTISDQTKAIESISARVEERLNQVPSLLCWLCARGIVAGGGWLGYMGKSFHNECFPEYRRITEKPDQDYKYINGEPIKEYIK